jgi:ELWxxDGT repeat protein
MPRRTTRHHRASRRAALEFLSLRGEQLEPRALLTLTPQLVADVNQEPAGLDVEWHKAPVEMGGNAYFSASAGGIGFELWKTDGTTSGTALVKDISPGGISSYPTELTNVSGTLFFSAGDARLWRSDGTGPGTIFVKDNASGGPTAPRDLTIVNGILFFIAFNGPTTALWKSDGSAERTIIVKAFNSASNLLNVNGVLFFSADDGTTGLELWKSDGTLEGTVLVKDIASGPGGSTLRTPMNVGGQLLFVANDGAHGNELWRSDGTIDGTVIVKDIRTGQAGSNPFELTKVSGALFFVANDGIHSAELWRSDGTEAGTALVRDIRAAEEYFGPRYLTNVNGTLFFSAHKESYGMELWRSDGTEAGTMIVKDIVPGSASSYARRLANQNGLLLFHVPLPAGYDLWKSDGTESGTTLVTAGIRADWHRPSRYTNIGGKLFFAVPDREYESHELWTSDGTAAGTKRLVRDAVSTASAGIADITVSGDSAYFLAVNGLWKTDATTGGTTLISPAASTSNLTKINGKLFFTTLDFGTSSLWTSDGTSAGTVKIRDFGPRYYLSDLIELNGNLYFQGGGPWLNYELWRSDGTAAGTVAVKEITHGAMQRLGGFVNVNGTLFFAANRDNLGTELWKSDGTTGGTVLVKDIRVGPANSVVQTMANINGTLFFFANDGVTGYELWKSDGTALGTVLVRDIHPDGASYSPFQLPLLTNVNGRLLFYVDGGANGIGVWQSDGTTEGTILLSGVGMARELENVNGMLFFAADFRLWKTDGTASGTTKVSDISQSGAFMRDFANVDGMLFFNATDFQHGAEIWRSDGTAEGTFRLRDVAQGGASSFPRDFQSLPSGRIIFTADDGLRGRELWTLVEINAAPSFIRGPDLEATDENGPRVIEEWANDVKAGPPDEAQQTVTFAVTTDRQDLFVEPPAIDASGRLTFTPQPNVSGTAQITVILRDDGGTTNGGVNVSPPQTFAITITKPRPWHNVVRPLDVNDDGNVVAGDVVGVVNYINAFGPGSVFEITGDGNFYDTSGDNALSAVDALRIINYINAQPKSAPTGEGEAATEPLAADVVFRKLGDASLSADSAGLDDWLAAVTDEWTSVPRRRPRW